MKKNKIKDILKKARLMTCRLLPTRKHWMVMSILFSTFVVVGFVLGASGADAAGIFDTVAKAVGYVLALLATWFARLFMGLAIFFLRFFIQLGAYNGFIDAPVVSLGWVMVRDVANMFFVVALMVIAFATILGRETYEWKRTMVKLVLSAIFINFSLLICQLVIDAAHVFTITFLNAIVPIAGGNFINMFHLTDIGQIVNPGEQVGDVGVDNLTAEIFLGAVMSAVFAGITMITMAVYTILMLVRTVILWVLMILSPLAYFFAVLPATQQYAKDWWGEFSKYVIMAPMMVFFLWLAFASMGNGQIADELNRGSTVGGVDTISEPEAAMSQGQNVTFSLGTTWHNMSSFLVAIAFLLVGIERVQKLGVKGGGWLDSATNFGKKVATIASGYTAGRWLAGKGAEKVLKPMAKDLGMRFGGAALQEKGAWLSSKIKTQGVRGLLTGGRLKGGYEGRENRTARVKKWEDKGREAKGFWKKLGWGVLSKGVGGVIEPAERKQKRASDWNKAAESAKETMMMNMRTSKSAAGMAKIEQGDRYRKQKAVSDEKGEFKEKHLETELIAFDRKLSERVEPRMQAWKTANPNANKDEQNKKLKELKATEFKGLKKEFTVRLQGEYGKRYGTMIANRAEDLVAKKKKALSVKAGMQNMAEIIEEDFIKEEAKARAFEYRGMNDNLRAKSIEKAAATTLVKKLQDLFNNLNYSEYLATGAELVEKVNGGGDPDKEAKGEEKRALLRQTTALLTSAAAKDSETGADAFRTMLGKTNWTEDINQDNRMRAVLSVLTGKVVGVDEEQTAADELKKSYRNEDEYNEAMRAMSDAFKRTAVDGASVMSGLIGEGVEKDSTTGEMKVVYDFGQNVGSLDKKGKARPAGAVRNFVQDTDQETIDYFAGRIQSRNVQSVADMGSTNLDGYLTGFKGSEVKALGTFFNGKNTNALANMQTSFWKSWNTAEVNNTNADEYLAAINEIKDNLGGAEYNKFKELTKDFISEVESQRPGQVT